MVAVAHTKGTLTVGRFARQGGVSPQTILYYERRGLLPPEGRTEAGYRTYGDRSVRTLRFIKNAQGLGFTLGEIRELVRIRQRGGGNCGAVRRRANDKLDKIREQLVQLRSSERALARLVRACPGGDHPLAKCPILRRLEGSSN